MQLSIIALTSTSAWLADISCLNNNHWTDKMLQELAYIENSRGTHKNLNSVAFMVMAWWTPKIMHLLDLSSWQSALRSIAWSYHHFNKVLCMYVCACVRKVVLQTGGTGTPTPEAVEAHIKLSAPLLWSSRKIWSIYVIPCGHRWVDKLKISRQGTVAHKHVLLLRCVSVPTLMAPS